MSDLICLGFGYCARHFVAAHGGHFARVVGTTRDPHKVADERVELLMFEGQIRSDMLHQAIAEASHLLISAAPGEAGDPVLAELHGEIAAAPKLQSIAYLSSIGVYGDHAGAWVDETTATVPAHARGGRPPP